ncbi:MAG: APC family permease [Ruminococcus flavefaciens]|nr:APC family permease [Ruminococcus flavefaciens]
MKEKKLGLPSVVATGVGLIVATSCLLSIRQGSATIGTPFIITMVIACAFNILTALSICELNALMPNLTGGMAQYTLACFGPFVSIVITVGGYLTCQTIMGSSEAAMFGNTLSSVFSGVDIPGWVYSVVLVILLTVLNLFGVDMFAKIQNIVAYSLIGSLAFLGIMGCLNLGTGEVVEQEAVISSNCGDIFSLLGLAFFLFIGVEFIVPISSQVKNARFNVPLGMVISLVAILVMQIFVTIGFSHYTPWEELGESTVPHILYGKLLYGKLGTVWMTIISLLAVISTINTALFSISQICSGMAKINLLPAVFMRKNKRGTPYVGLLMVSLAVIIINATGLSTSDQLTFLILTGCTFWIFSYIILHCDVIILRKRLPKAPRTFKLPLGCVIPVIGIIGNAFMIYNIDSDWNVKKKIYAIFLIVLAVLSVYAVIWIKYVMKRPLFKVYQIKEVMAMETDLYQINHNPKMAERLHLDAKPEIESMPADFNTGTRPEK